MDGKEASELLESLIERAREKTRVLRSSQIEWDYDITLKVFRACSRDEGWMRDYTSLGHWPEINKAVGKAIRAEVDGTPLGRIKVRSENFIIRSYTVHGPPDMLVKGKDMDW